MRTEGQRRSDNFEDRGTGRGGGGGGVPVQALFGLLRLLGLKGTLIVGGLITVGLLVMPAGLKQQLLAALLGGSDGAPSEVGASVCEASPANGAACDFSRVVLASTFPVVGARRFAVIGDGFPEPSGELAAKPFVVLGIA